MKLWHYAALGLVVVVSIAASLLSHHDPQQNQIWDTIPVFWVVFGFVGCVLLVAVAKYILAPLANKKEDYYHDDI
jgi:hypothetical protein